MSWNGLLEAVVSATSLKFERKYDEHINVGAGKWMFADLRSLIKPVEFYRYVVQYW